MDFKKQIYADNLAYAKSADLEIMGVEKIEEKIDTQDEKTKNLVRVLKASSFGCQQKNVHSIVRELLKIQGLELPYIEMPSNSGSYTAFDFSINTHIVTTVPILVNVVIPDTGPSRIESGSLYLFNGSRISTSGNLLLFAGTSSQGEILPYEIHANTCRLATENECEDYVRLREESETPLVQTSSWGGGKVIQSPPAPMPW